MIYSGVSSFSSCEKPKASLRLDVNLIIGSIVFSNSTIFSSIALYKSSMVESGTSPSSSLNISSNKRQI